MVAFCISSLLCKEEIQTAQQLLRFAQSMVAINFALQRKDTKRATIIARLTLLRKEKIQKAINGCFLYLFFASQRKDTNRATIKIGRAHV